MAKLILKDMVFVTTVAEVTGLIHAEQGIPMFYNKERGILSPLPCFIRAEFYETEVNAFVRIGSKEVILEPGPHDRLEGHLRKYEYDVFLQYDQIMDNRERAKLSLVPRALACSAGSLIGFIVLLVGVLLLKLWPVTAVGFLAFVIGNLCTRHYRKALDSEIVYDRKGNWINIVTGETSLNDGLFIL